MLQALEELEFDNFIQRCEGELAKFQSVQCDKRNNYRRKVREEAKAKQAADIANGVIEQIPGPPVATIPTFSVRNRDLPPAAKKLRALGVGAGTGAGAESAETEGTQDAVPVDVDDEDDVDMNDEAVQEDDVPDDEDDVHDEEEGAEEDEEIEEDPNSQLVEDPLEEREGEEDEDEVLEGEESD